MGNVLIGVNMEFVRSADKSFEAGVKIASDIGYEYIEPMVHLGRELLSEAGYFHSFSMDEDALSMRQICDRYDVKISSLSAHCPLMRPEISVPYLRRAIQFAADLEVSFVNTDEGVKPAWMSDEMAWKVMEYTLSMVMQTAERYGVYVCIEDHQIYSKTPEGLLRIAGLVDSPYLQVNYDSGNAFIAGTDPYEMLDKVLDRVYHVHGKDIGGLQLEERGKVTGVAVGVACGEGVIDWTKIVEKLKTLDRDVVISVECGTIEQAKSSLDHLKKLV
ncbi:MAG: sugar phosphate isomerase/epimerase [Candidatus Omnitrophota bacterium]|jgi:sugar phosphate isomerase/epimerase|nr:MAG: sugar phosphate isomerase/epimerase [Candidatus Omnitrophota bacterium]